MNNIKYIHFVEIDIHYEIGPIGDSSSKIS